MCLRAQHKCQLLIAVCLLLADCVRMCVCKVSMSQGLVAVIAHCCCLGWLLLLRRARIGRRRVGLVLVRHFSRLWHERVLAVYSDAEGR